MLKRTDLIICTNCDQSKQARRFAKISAKPGYKSKCKLCCKRAMKKKLTKSKPPFVQ